MIDNLIQYDNFIINMLLSVDHKCKYIKKDDRIELKSILDGFISTMAEDYRNLWNKNRELEEQNLKLYKVFYFLNIYAIELDHIDNNCLELALQNDDQITSNTFVSLQAIQSNYVYYILINEHPPKDINELKEFMRDSGQAPKYEEVKDKLSNILKTIKI
jgi:hypothetical protein